MAKHEKRNKKLNRASTASEGVASSGDDLYERARTQWQFGDWESLAQIEHESLFHHPQRAKLALLVASGHQQRGDTETTREFTRLAQEWGASKKLVSQVLIAGVYNTLGKASALCGQQQRALGHFEQSLRTAGDGGDVRLLAEARETEQNHQINVHRSSRCSLSVASSLNQIQKKDSLLTTTLDATLFVSSVDIARTLDELHRFMAETFNSVEIPSLSFTSIDHVGKSYYFVHFADDYIPEKIAATGKFYEQPFLSLLSQLYKPEGLVIDCGANIGNHSIYFAGVMGAEVISFEPQPCNKIFLDANRRLNGLEERIISRGVALSSEHGRFSLAMAVEGNYGTFTSDMAHVSRTRGNQTFDKYEVTSSTIDDELGESVSSVSIIKLDVEGMELAVLKGAVNTIQKSHPVISVECFTKSIYDEVKGFLDAYSYFVLDSTNATPTFIFLTSENQYHWHFLRHYLAKRNLEKFDKNKEFNQIV